MATALRVRFGPFRIRWVFEHRDYIAGRQFRDVQLSGSSRRWGHTHLFTPESPGVCTLEDLIDYELPLGALGNFLAGWIVRRKLKELFAFRHRVTADALGPSHSKNPRRLIESPNEQVSHVSEPQDAFKTSALLSHTVTYGTRIALVSFRFAECALDSICAA